MRVFISHSSRDADDVNLRDSVARVVTEAGCAVLMDRLTLRSGDLWRREIYSWILLAQSAVIVLTRSAFRSRWVPRECMVLAWRRELDPKFRVHIVLAPDITPDKLKDPPFDDLNLSEFNVVQASADPTLSQLASALAGQKGAMPLGDAIVGRLEEVLAPLILAEGRLQAAASELQLRMNGWESQFTPVRRLAVGLAQYGFWRHRQNGQELRPGLSALRYLEDRLKAPDGPGASVVETLAPSWVDTIAAGKLYAALRCKNRRVLVVIAEFEETLLHHLARAWSAKWLKGPQADQLDDPVPEHAGSRLDALKAAVYSAYRHRLPVTQRNKPAKTTNGLIDDVLRKRNDEGVPHVFYVNGNGTPAIGLTDLVELQAAMPYIACAWMTRDRRSVPDSCRVIRPIGTSRLERNAMADYSEAYSILIGSDP
jgi:hypothetical protein